MSVFTRGTTIVVQEGSDLSVQLAIDAELGAREAEAAAEAARDEAAGSVAAVVAARDAAEGFADAAEASADRVDLGALDVAVAATAADAVATSADVLATAADRVQTGLDVAAADTARIAAETAETNAETARDAAFVNADVYADTAAGLAAVAEGEQFQVVSGDEIIRYEDVAGAAVEVARYPAASIREYITEPFPLQSWGNTTFFPGVVNPASGITATAQEFTVASAGRIYFVPTIASLGLAVGDVIRLAFRRTAGTGQPANITFRAGATLVATVDFVLRGGWYIAEATIPATTTIVRLDWTNGTGAAATITRPRVAKAISIRFLPDPVRTRIDTLAADPGNLPNLWSGAATVARLNGTGDIADVAINADGTIDFPSDINVSIRAAGGSLIRPNGSVMTVLVKVSSNAILFTGINVRWVGATTGTALAALQSVGDGWYVLAGSTATTADPVGIGTAYIEVDNRENTYAGSGYTSAPITVEQIIIVDGAEIPLRKPAPAPDTFPDSEVVLTQSAGGLQIHHRAGDGTYVQWPVARYDDAATRALGWRVSGLSKVTRSGETAFGSPVALGYAGEHELAIRESGKSDFMGGATHGDQEETRDLTVLVDGFPVTIDGATSYRAQQVELIQRSELLEVDNATRTVTANVTTRWLWRNNELRLYHHIEWVRSITVTTCYLGMWSLLRPGVTDAARWSPVYAPFDVSAVSHGAPQGAFERITLSGPLGGFAAENVRGWSDYASPRSFVEDGAGGNKVYFAPFPFAGTAVTAGDVIEWETLYRIGLS
jgi:hypothetical protein